MVQVHKSATAFNLTQAQKYLDGLVCVGDEGNEEWQDHVDEQGDEGVEVSPAKEPHQSIFVL